MKQKITRDSLKSQISALPILESNKETMLSLLKNEEYKQLYNTVDIIQEKIMKLVSDIIVYSNNFADDVDEFDEIY